MADVIKDTEGNIINSPVVNRYLGFFYKVRKYQLIQIGEKDYLLKVVSDKGSYSTDEYVRACKQFLGERRKLILIFLIIFLLKKLGNIKLLLADTQKILNIKTNNCFVLYLVGNR